MTSTTLLARYVSKSVRESVGKLVSWHSAPPIVSCCLLARSLVYRRTWTYLNVRLATHESYSSRLTPGDLLLTTCSFVLTTRCFAGGRGPTAGVTRRTAVTRPERNRERLRAASRFASSHVCCGRPRPASPLACARASTTTPILALLSLQAGWLCFAGWPCVCSPHPSHAPSNYGRLFFRQRRLFLQTIPLKYRRKRYFSV